MNPITDDTIKVGAIHDDARWPIAGLFLDALARRDFAAMAACLHPDVSFRALVPSGPFAVDGTTETIDRFQRWFGGDDDFEVEDASIGQLGARLYLRWRIRMQVPGEPNSVRLAEQHVFATVGELIESLDLLCSGFQAEHVAPRRVVGS